jgi:hypothetical protein
MTICPHLFRCLLKRVYYIAHYFAEGRESSGNFSLFFIDTLSVFLTPSGPRSPNKGVVKKKSKAFLDFSDEPGVLLLCEKSSSTA